MKISYIYLLLTLNFVTTAVTYYRKCYDEVSICLITNIDDSKYSRKFRLDWLSAVKWCTEKSSSLAIITNANVQSALAAFINDSSAKLDSDVITNAYRSNLDYWEWIGRRISATYPFSERRGYRYAYLLVSAGRVVTVSVNLPTAKRNFICSYLSHNSNCSKDHHQLGSSCYKIHNNEAATWFDARNLCLQEGYDLATFEDVNIYTEISKEWLGNGEYWIGLWKEFWNWRPEYEEIKYSNWDILMPNTTGGNCLCLTANTGKWKDCDCYQEHRYICIEDYASYSSTTPASTTTTTTATPTTTQITPSSRSSAIRSTLPTTDSVTHSTPISMLDYITKQSDDLSQKPEMLLALCLGIGCLLIVIAATAVVVHFKTRRSSSHHPGPSCDAPSTTTVTNADAPNTVYAEIIPKASESTRSPSEETPNQIVYAELDLIPKGNKDEKALQELEYANSIQLNSLYANCAHTRV